MIKGKGWAKNIAQHEDSFGSESLSKPLALGKESISNLSDLKTALIKVTEFNGATFFITNEGTTVSVYLNRPSGALRINSIEIDSGIQTLKNTKSDILLISSTGQEYSLIADTLKVSKASENLNNLEIEPSYGLAS